MVLPTARKPEGGFQFITVVQVCAVWTAYYEQRIRLFDVRLWFAAQEMLARRSHFMTSKPSQYQQAELHALIGTRKGSTAALARLQAAGLLRWERTALSFPLSAIEINKALAGMLAQIPNHNRRIPVPRRLLRFLAKHTSRVSLATMLGHLVRCLYYRQGQCRAEGFCKASWIAQVFGVSARAVKTARQHLEGVGFLIRCETPQWVRNRYGQKITINLQWREGPRPGHEIPVLHQPIAPPRALESLQIAPPDSNTQLLPEINHQNPANSRPSGVLSTLFLQARVCVRNGSTLPEEKIAPQQRPAVLVNASAPSPARKPRSFSPPCLHQIILADLLDIERLIMLYNQAVRRQLIGPAEADRLSFVALAQQVLHVRPTNPGGLFWQLLHQRRFVFITQDEEDQARRRLLAYVYPDTEKRARAVVA